MSAQNNLSPKQFIEHVPLHELMNYQTDHGPETVAHAEGFTRKFDYEEGKPMDHIYNLGHSMQSKGQKQPIDVIEHPESGARKVVNGHHRIYGAAEVGMESLKDRIHKPVTEGNTVKYPTMNREGYE